MKRTNLTVFLTFLIFSGIFVQLTDNSLVINADQGKEIIHKNIYGHFAEHLGRCIYSGICVGEDYHIPNIREIRVDAIEALKEISVPVIRWPGECFVDDYNWKEGIGPKEDRPELVNLTWGGVENNSFGTHESLDRWRLLFR